MEFLTKYNHAKVVSPSGRLSMTDQQFVGECDINLILKKYRVTGVLPEGLKNPRFEDVSEVGDFVAVMDRVNKAKADFSALPSDVRERFGNDVAAFYGFICNPDNREECVKLGLFSVRQEEDDAVSVLKRIEKSVSGEATKAATSADA